MEALLQGRLGPFCKAGGSLLQGGWGNCAGRVGDLLQAGGALLQGRWGPFCREGGGPSAGQVRALLQGTRQAGDKKRKQKNMVCCEAGNNAMRPMELTWASTVVLILLILPENEKRNQVVF